jgi:Mu transposase, C-terminal
MNRTKHVTIERQIHVNGIDVHGVRYQSPALQRLKDEFGTASVRVIPNPLDLRYIRVWHPYSAVWIDVPLAKLERLATQDEIDDIARSFHSREQR